MISVSSVLCDRPCKRLPCLHEQAFAGQRTADGFAVSCPLDRGRTRKISFPYLSRSNSVRI